MKLYHNPASPFVRKVRVAIAEAGRAGEVELIPSAGSPTAPIDIPPEHNPLGKIPALVADDGEVLFDSRVICRYLDALWGIGLYPAPPALWRCLTLEALADGMMEAAVLMVYETRCRHENARSEAWVEGQWAKIDRALDLLEGPWFERIDLAPLGDARPDMGRLAVACALGYLDLRHDDRDWRAGRPRLSAWFAEISDRPSLVTTAPEG
ncbi:MAG: glutathione S-transferase [Alphaproteobacteria bacterium]|nr:MAG: glutathione S-transferase [Alphaproteobacteria bacterium]